MQGDPETSAALPTAQAGSLAQLDFMIKRNKVNKAGCSGSFATAGSLRSLELSRVEGLKA